ncbi:MAG: Lipoprotein signal peptidase [Alphaproteobacteria bacterium ADurb.Bin438]|nr:MAG: Lipoprotein signal peptidase [Alphaproteobacteria bacterium ADurb.Bin438]
MKKALITIITVFVLDQLSKWYILEHVMNPPKVLRINDFLNIVLAWNRGVSFSMFANGGEFTPHILTIITVVIFCGLIYWIRKEKSQANQVLLALIAGGALGNIVDRIRFKAVVDFIDFYIYDYHWPAFNIADSAICVGAILFMVYPYLTNKKEKESK